jgi:hypothetical protein
MYIVYPREEEGIHDRVNEGGITLHFKLDTHPASKVE